jgi:hypothetical protein
MINSTIINDQEISFLIIMVVIIDNSELCVIFATKFQKLGCT